MTVTRLSRVSTLFFVLLAGLSVLLAGFFPVPASGQNPAGWGLREPSPAVVHPVMESPFQKVISLRGTWDFATLDTATVFNELPDPEYKTAAQSDPVFPELETLNWRTIEVPGCWEAQGVGEPGMSETWDIKSDHNPRPLRHKYMGAVCYRKRVDIPDNGGNQEVWLKVGGVRTEAWFWVNRQPIGRINNYCGSYKFNLTEFVTPGETAEIVAIVRNDTPSRKGQMCDFHRFGGFYRDVEIELTPGTWIDDVWVQGHFDPETGAKTARVHLTLQTVREEEQTQVYVTIKTRNGETIAEKSFPANVVLSEIEQFKSSADSIIANAPETVVELSADKAELWSPESPALYLAEIKIQNADGSCHGWVERFGFRRFNVVGNRFYLNGKPYFVRGYGETFIYPQTMTSPADPAVHLTNMKFIKAAGFCYARMHTHCEIPEYFEAADEAGILIQPELPYYCGNPTESFDFNPMRELKELYRHYRRYVSWGTYCMGNEGWLGSPVDKELCNWVRENDPDRPCQHQDGSHDNRPENSDFDSPLSSIKPWPRGLFDELQMPFIAHEFLNLSVKLDPRLEECFTGAIKSPVSMNEYEERLQKLGISRELGDGCIRSAHALQACYQKAGIEAARLDPACDGYSFWNFIDQMVIQRSAYTSQGYLNAFYEVKDGGIPIEEFSQFNALTVLLANFGEDTPIVTGGQKINVQFSISHFDRENLPDGKIRWVLSETPDRFVSGTVPFHSMETGEIQQLASVEIMFPESDKPGHWTLAANIEGTEIANHWDFWCFPERQKSETTGFTVSEELYPWFREHYSNVVLWNEKSENTEGLLITTPDEEAFLKGLEQNRPVIVIRPATGDPNVELGWWTFGGQLGTIIAESPAFGDFPHNGLLTPLWFRLIKTDSLYLGNGPCRWKPLILGETVDSYCLYLGEAKIGRARVLASFGIDLMNGTPEAFSLLDVFIRYAQSDEFSPDSEIPSTVFSSPVPEGFVAGYRRVISSPETSFGPAWYTDTTRISTCRQTDRQNRLDWETAKVSRKDLDGQAVKFIFAGGLGYANQPITDGFELLLNDKPVLRFDVPESQESLEPDQHMIWNSTNDEITLDFQPLALFSDGQDFSGNFILTVPKERLNLNRPQKLSVQSLGEGSSRWFDLYSSRGFIDR